MIKNSIIISILAALILICGAIYYNYNKNFAENPQNPYLSGTVSEKGPYSQIPQRKTVEGVTECLPHRNTSGPQTLECAFGIKETGTNYHYAVNLNLLAQQYSFETGVNISVEGVFVPIEQISTNMWQKYNIVGIISVTSLQKK